jgi:hypothetical protein
MSLKKEMIMDGIGRGFWTSVAPVPFASLPHRYDPKAAVERAAFGAFPEAKGGDGDDSSTLRIRRLLEVRREGSLPFEARPLMGHPPRGILPRDSGGRVPGAGSLPGLLSPQKPVFIPSDSGSSSESDGDK